MPDDTLFLLLNAFFIIGLGLIVSSIISFFNTWRFLRRSVITSGTVITMVKSNKGMLAPKVKFTTAEGETITFTHLVSSRPAAYQTGQAVSVLYQSSRPHAARLNTFVGVWLTSLVLLFMGLVFTLAAMSVLGLLNGT
jgi:hypothetical protein